MKQEIEWRTMDERPTSDGSYLIATKTGGFVVRTYYGGSFGSSEDRYAAWAKIPIPLFVSKELHEIHCLKTKLSKAEKENRMLKRRMRRYEIGQEET